MVNGTVGHSVGSYLLLSFPPEHALLCIYHQMRVLTVIKFFNIFVVESQKNNRLFPSSLLY